MCPESRFLAAIVTFSCVLLVVPAKILLLFPIPFLSHWKAYIPLFEELASRGHHITAYTTIKGLKSFENFEHISITTNLSGMDTRGSEFLELRSKSVASYFLSLWSKFLPVNEAVLESKEIQALMQSEENFDLIITEATFYEESMLGFSHKFGAPVVNLFPNFMNPWMAQLAGVPHSFSYIPDTLEPYSDRMSFWQRTKNLIIGIMEILAVNIYYLPQQEKIMRRHFRYPGAENMPPLKEMISNISLHLVFSHPMMSYIRPYPPHVINVAGMNIKRTAKLPQDLQTFLDGATDGFIYVSFGSFIDPKTFSKRFQNILIDTLKGVKLRVIVKLKENIEDASHILTKPWLPQLEVLSHPNCRLFITHGGFNGLMEAMIVGVPTLGLPFFTDQWHNVNWYKHKGIGLDINYEADTVPDLTEKINTIISTPSFTENAKRIAVLYRDEPQSRLDNAAFWVEYVIRHKGAHHLKPASVFMPYYQYLLLDVIAFLAASLVLIVYIAYYIIRRVTRLLSGTNYVSQAKKRT